MAERSEPEFTVIGELSDRAIEALAALLLSRSEDEKLEGEGVNVDRLTTDAEPSQQLGRIV